MEWQDLQNKENNLFVNVGILPMRDFGSSANSLKLQLFLELSIFFIKGTSVAASLELKNYTYKV